MCEFSLSIVLFIFGFLNGILSLSAIAYVIWGMISFPCFLYGLWFIFNFKAKRQGIDLGSLNVIRLFADICSEVSIDYVKSPIGAISDK